ncbi:Clp protease N-terminal domain-containing protein [Streptacidiphilus neutrinimicus]|uniref:Clp protease N-terminal domain-containing protein n=1 Tax=Streptacidiphilus neutrinimicus TaxID=105420 RepID=UPI0005A62C70|nr:Clp protease N-terminal domain-containing protein [Streptacidiphilus neutrinimicus]
MFEYFTGRAKRAIVVGQDEAIALGHDFMGTEHLLLGLAADPESAAGSVLAAHGVDADRTREVTVRLLTEAGVDATGGRPASDALASIGIDVAEIRRRADESFGEGKFQFPRPAYTPHAKAALEQTLREAKALGHERFGTEHMLLGILAVGGDDAERTTALAVLTALDVNTAALRPALLSRITEG